MAIVIILFIWMKKENRAKECKKHFAGGFSGGSCPSYCMGEQTEYKGEFDASYQCKPSKLFNIF